MLFDAIVISGIVIFTIIGYFKGFLSQFSTLAGLIIAYVFSPKGAVLIQGIVRDLFPYSYVVDDMLSRLFAGLVIFIAVKIAGKFVEYIFISKFKEMGAINKWGGFFFGFIKAVFVLFILMAFVTLIPSKIVKKRFQVLESSMIYKISKKYNPVVNPKAMEDLRKLGELTRDEKKLFLINQSATFKDYLKTKNLENPLEDERAMDSFQKGDLESLKKNGLAKFLEDKDFIDFIHGEKYYRQPNETVPSK